MVIPCLLLLYGIFLLSQEWNPRALHMGLYGLPGLVADGFLHRKPEDGFGAVAVVGGVALVGKLAAQAGQVEIGHQRWHRVGNQAQQRVAGASLARGVGCVG